MVHLAILGLLISHEVQIGHGCLSSQFVDQFGLPKQHNVLGVLDGLLDLGSQEVARLSLLDLVDLTECATSKLFNDFVALVKNLLSFFHT